MDVTYQQVDRFKMWEKKSKNYVHQNSVSKKNIYALLEKKNCKYT